jgi:hypothetical protein
MAVEGKPVEIAYTSMVGKLSTCNVLELHSHLHRGNAQICSRVIEIDGDRIIQYMYCHTEISGVCVCVCMPWVVFCGGCS